MKKGLLNKVCYVVLFLFAVLPNAQGQIDTADVNITPYGVVYNHLYYLQKDSYNAGRAAWSLPGNVEKPKKVAVQLKRILDGKGFYVDLNRLPQDPNFIDSASGESIYFINRDEPRIYLEKHNGQWFYSRTTIHHIQELFKEVYPLGANLIQHLHGPFWDFEILTISVAKWVGVLILLVFGVLTFYLVRYLSRTLVVGFLSKRIKILSTSGTTVNKVSRVVSLFVVTRLILYLLPEFELPVRVHAVMILVLGVLSIFFLILLLLQISNLVFSYLAILTERTENTLDDQLLPVLSRIVKIVIWALGMLYILDFLDVNIMALLAGISIGGLAIALAAQDTVKNFFGSIMIFVDRPFQIGDWVNFDDVDGTVEEVGVRSTRIRTFSNSLVSVPNGMLADKVVNNMGLRQYRRFKTDLGVMYSTPPHKIDLFVEGIREIIKKHPDTRKDYFEVHLNGFADSAITILLYCFFEASDWSAELKARHEVMYAILILAEELGVSFAFPSQSIYVESLPSEKSTESISEAQLKSGMHKIESYFKGGNKGSTT